MPPLFSIVTATFNAQSCLPRLLESLAAQTERSFNLILQDGASTDDTVAMVEARRADLPQLLLESRPDAGIYDAWNRALDNAGDNLGEWVIFLGADDSFAAPDSLWQVRQLVESLPSSVHFAFGDCLLVDYASGESRLVPSHPHNPLLIMQRYMAIANTACFYRRPLFETQRFDPGFRIAGDYEFMLRTWKQNAQGQYLDLVVTHMGLGGISNNPGMARLALREHYRAIFKNNKKRYVILKSKAAFVRLCSVMPGGGVLLPLCRKAKKRLLGR